MRLLLACFAFLVSLALGAPAHAAQLTVLAPVLSAEAQETFAQDYGLREIPYLQKSLQTRIERRLAHAGVELGEAGAATLRITLLEAKPSRLTFKQLTKRNTLDYSLSRSLGGAKMRAELLDGAGNIVDTLDYAWYEYDLRSSLALVPWHDTERAFDFFATKLRKWYGARA